MSKITKPVLAIVPTPNTGNADADAERQRRLFEWVVTVLEKLGLVRAVKQARSIQDLRRITLNVDDAALEIRDALHPASGKPAEYFHGLNAGHLKRILKNRFEDLKKDREKELRRRRGGATQSDWSDGLILNDKDGSIKPVIANLILILSEAPAWKGVLAFDEFSAKVVIRRRPPWGKELPDTLWSDHHETQVRVWFQSDVKINPSMGDVGRAVLAAARHNSFHAVREYLERIVWDGTPRLATWLELYFHAKDSTEDNEYLHAIGPRWSISAVARIYEPGCKADHTLVLEGPQGQQKSEALRILAIRREWFTDRLSHLASKDAAQEVTAVWIIEISEMEAFARASASTAKAFLTRPDEHYRPPHGKHTIRRLRQSVFAGTINPPAGGYLRDPTGARRFWPVACGDDDIDLDGLKRDRDQLWGEAVHLYKAGTPWWLETPELKALAGAEQRARFKLDAWEEPIREWLGERSETGVTEVLQDALGFAIEQHTQSAMNRVVTILTHLGYTRCRPRTSEGRQRPQRYRREPTPHGKSDE